MSITRRNMIGGLVAACVGAGLSRRLLGAMPTTVQYKPTDTGPGHKFSAAGVAQRYPGNTILCHLNQPGPQFDKLQHVVGELRAATGDANIKWLPASSYHMTVFDGVLDLRRQSGDWLDALPLHASLQECNEFITARLHNFDLGFDPPIRMVADEQQIAPTQTCFPLRPVDADETRRLRDLRNRLSKALGIRHPNHEGYTFHISFGYYIRAFDLTAQEAYRTRLLESIVRLRQLQPVIEMGAPEFCLFEDMMSFRTEFSLKAHAPV